MVKTILIPVDFHVASLNTLKLALESIPAQKLKVILIYPKDYDNSITDLLFNSPQKIIHSLISPEFKEGLEIIKNRFREKIVYLSIRLFYSNNKIFLKNFIEANAIDAIVIPKNYKFQTTRKVFNPMPLFKKVNIPVLEMNLDATDKNLQQEQLLALFN